MLRPFALLNLLLSATLAMADEPKINPKDIVLTEKAKAIHQRGILIDGHNDLPWALRTRDGLEFRSVDIARPQPTMHTDLIRLREGGVKAQFWSAYVPASTREQGTAIKMTLEQIDVIKRLVKKYPNDLEMAYSTADIERITKASKIASLIGVEGGYSIDDSLAILRTLYELGVRYMTLTHSDSLDWADSATDDPVSGGLSPFGEEVIREMNRLGMLVDLSHVSPDTMKAVLKIAKAPVIFSHSSARAIADHPRNVPDDVLKLIKKNGGVVMVNFYSGFIVPEGARAMKTMFDVGREFRKKYPDDDEKFQAAMDAWRQENDYPAGTVHTIADHIDQIVKVAGIDHVGIGSDFDGISRLPYQMEDVSKYPYLTQELLNRGYDEKQIHKILGGNLLRAFAEAEKVAAASK